MGAAIAALSARAHGERDQGVRAVLVRRLLAERQAQRGLAPHDAGQIRNVLAEYPGRIEHVRAGAVW